MRAAAVLLLAGLCASPALAHAGDEGACASAIASAERTQSVPARVLGTIATVESGRAVGNRVVPWPWAINADGVGHFYRSKAEAIAAVQALRFEGARSIDVGCMQINLAAHPLAFPSLEEAFDPAVNAAYAARFLRTLYQQTGRLAAAMTAYHSHTPAFAADYARRLLAVWPQAAAFGLSDQGGPAPAVRPSPPSADGARASRSSIEVVSIHGTAWPSPRR